VRALSSITAAALAGTDGASYPFWSPDSREIAFFAQGKLKKISAAGGPTVNLADAVNARGGSWSRDGVILFARDAFGCLYRMAAGGGAAVAVTRVTAANEGDRFPEFLPDGHRFLFLRNATTEGGLYAGDLAGGAPVRLLPDITNAAYVPGQGARSGSGFLFFRRDNTLMAQPYDPERQQTTGDVIPIAEQVSVAGNVGYGAYAASQSGTIAFMPGLRNAARRMVWLDRAGQRVGTVGKPEQISEQTVSPDGKVVAFTLGDQTAGNSEVWLQNLDTDVRSRFTVGPGLSASPLWAPDGTRLVFAVQTSASSYEIRMLSATSPGGRPEVLLQGPFNSIYITAWSPDRKSILFSSRSEKTRDDLWVLPMGGDRKASVLLQTPANERDATFSPHGDWIAYVSDESGQPEVWVQHFPLNGSKFQISSAGGTFAQWSRDGKELFFRTPDGTIMSLPVTAAATFERGQARALFTVGDRDGRAVSGGDFEPSADGKRFLLMVSDGETPAEPVIVWTNWQETLRR
jgi:Tol biopolymer transport system component